MVAVLKLVTVTTRGLGGHKYVFRDPVSVWSDGIFLVVFYFNNVTLCRQTFTSPYILDVDEVDWLISYVHASGKETLAVDYETGITMRPATTFEPGRAWTQTDQWLVEDEFVHAFHSRAVKELNDEVERRLLSSSPLDPVRSCTCEWCRGINDRNRRPARAGGIVTDGS